jgi:hypothetical protein
MGALYLLEILKVSTKYSDFGLERSGKLRFEIEIS